MNLSTLGSALAAVFCTYYAWLAFDGVRDVWSRRQELGGLPGLICLCARNLIRFALGVAALMGVVFLIGTVYTVYFFMTRL